MAEATVNNPAKCPYGDHEFGSPEQAYHCLLTDELVCKKHWAGHLEGCSGCSGGEFERRVIVAGMPSRTWF